MPLPPDSQAEELTTRGQALLEQGDPREARPMLEQALALWQQANHLAGATHTLELLALAARRSHLPLLAKEYLLQALLNRRQLGDRPHEAELLTDLGNLFASIGERAAAIAYYSQARALYQSLLDREGEGVVLLAIGKAHQEAGDTQAALPFFREAFPLLRGTARWTEEVSRMEQLADTLSLAHDIFGAFGRQGKRATLEEIADTLSSRAAAGSLTAARLSETFSAH